MRDMSIFRRPARQGPQSPVAHAEPIVAVTREDLESVLSPLAADLRDRLGKAARPAVRYATARLTADQKLPVGYSKLGGLPDLPAGVTWPTWTPPTGDGATRPLTFFAQLDLAKVSTHLDFQLPADGLLLFFADFDFTGESDGVCGLFADELDGAQVVHAPTGAALTRTPAPSGVEVLPEASVAPLLVWTLSMPEDLADETEYEAFEAADEELKRRIVDAAPVGYLLRGAHQLGGHAEYIQHTVESEVVQAAYDVYRRDSGFDRERWDEVADKVAEWSILLQFDSDDSLGLMFGDVGTLWWAAPTVDIAAGRWGSARFNFQCS